MGYNGSLSGNAAIDEHTKRLKERFKEHGLKGFNNREALELLLALTGTGKNPGELSAALVAGFDSLGGVIGAQTLKLSSMQGEKGGEGLGGDGLVLMALIKSLARSYGKERLPEATVINTKQDVLCHVNRVVPCRKGEKFIAIYLNSRNEVLGTWVLHEGTVTRKTVTARRAIEGAFHYNGQGVIFVHRHDRASDRPTVQEARLIKWLWSAASAVDLIVHDHLIFGRLSLYSALEDGLISAGEENHSMAASPKSGNCLLNSR